MDSSEITKQEDEKTISEKVSDAVEERYDLFRDIYFSPTPEQKKMRSRFSGLNESFKKLVDCEEGAKVWAEIRI
jgi:hypothetical protein